MSKNFFDEIVDVPKYERFTVYGIGAVIFLIMLWVYNSIPEYSIAAGTFILMMIIWVFGLSFDLVWQTIRKPEQAAVNGIGKKPVMPFFIGIVVGFLFVNLAFSIVPFAIVSGGALSFIFIVVAAPFVEANFFRGVIQPTFTLLFKDWTKLTQNQAGVVAMIITSMAFALFHVNVLSSADVFSVYSYVPYFVFGVVSTLLVYGTRSVAAEYGLHGVNNFLAVGGLGLLG